MRASSYNIVVHLPDSDRKLIFHGYTGAVDLVQPHVADILQPGADPRPAPRARVSPATVRALARRGYLTEKSQTEETGYAQELGIRVHRVMRRHAAPGVLVVPSYACNLRCEYCYERDLRARGTAWLTRRMTPEQADAFLQAVTALGGASRPPHSLTFYGGEPFQQGNAPIVRYIHHRAREAGFRSFSAVSNGVELDRFADLLGPGGGIVFLQITLDGPGRVHDSRRCLPGGRGTFARITANISLALERGVRVSVRMNIDRSNADTVHEVHEFFRGQGWDRSPLFHAYCSPVHGTEACSNGNGSCFASHIEMQQVVERNLAGRSPDPPGEYLDVASLTRSVQKRILEHLQQRRGLPRWRTAFCGSNMSMFVFDPFGDIYPCWEVIGRTEHRIGTYGPGRLELDERAVDTWHNRSVVEIRGCRACAYLFFCGGGCQAFAIARTGRADEPHCLDFPRHFQAAAVQAFRQWEAMAAPGQTAGAPGPEGRLQETRRQRCTTGDGGRAAQGDPPCGAARNPPGTGRKRRPARPLGRRA